MKNKTILAVLFTVFCLLGFILRAWQLDLVPLGFHGDEGEWALSAQKIARGKGKGVFKLGWDQHPNLFSYIQSISMSYFGENMIGARFPTVIAGSIVVGLIFLIGRAYFDLYTGIFGATLAAFGAWSVHYSRLGMNDMFVVLFFCLFAYCFKQGWVKNQSLTLALSGFSLGTSFYFGNKAIVCLPLFLAFLTMGYLFSKESLKSKLIKTGLILTFAILAFLPLGISSPGLLKSHWQRIKQRAISPSKTEEGLFLKLDDMFLKNSLVFFKNIDQGFFISLGPLLAYPVNILMIVGFLTILIKKNKWPSILVAVWFLVSWSASLLTNSPPNSHRMILSFPPAYLLSGLALKEIKGFFKKNLKTESRTLGLGFLTLAIGLGLNSYFPYIFTPRHDWPWVEVTLPAKQIKKICPDYTLNLLAPQINLTHGSIAFISRGCRAGKDIETYQQTKSFLSKNEKTNTWLFLFSGNRKKDLRLVEKKFPDGEKRVYTDSSGKIIYIEYLVL